MKMKNVALSIILFTTSMSALAAKQATNNTLITHMYAYDDYLSDTTTNRTPEQADIMMRLNTGVSTCPHGVYINGKALGAKTMTTLVLTRYTAGQPVRFQVYDDRIFRGSSSKMCEVDAVILKN